MDKHKVAFVPVQQNMKLHFGDSSNKVYDTVYRQLVGSLNYLTTTRTNIEYFFRVLSQFMARPPESHWKVAKGVLEYLKGIIDFGLKYTNSFDVELTGYSNLD